MRYRDRLHQLAVFYEAQDATLKALGHDVRLKFLLGDPDSSGDEFTVRCRQLSPYPAAGSVAQLRAKQDAKAVRQRFGVTRTWLDRFAFSRRFHEAMEQIRCELLATQFLEGVADNLAARLFDKPGEDLVDIAVSHARHFLSVPGEAWKDEWGLVGVPGLETKLRSLPALIESPIAYHRQVARIADLLPDTEEAKSGLSLNYADSDSDRKGISRDEKLTEAPLTEDSEPEDEPAAVSRTSRYHVFDRALDRESAPSELATTEVLESLRKQLDTELRASRVSLARLAGRLSNLLSVVVPSEWEGDHEDGMLDIDRLDQIVSNPAYRLAYRREREFARRDTQVCILIDNSGSMRGRPIIVSALCADMLCRVMERFGIAVEILGFTTRFWRGGDIRDRWVTAGRPAGSGRLNALEHIIYKSADQSWRKSRLGLALMLDEQLLKENIDGEALLWASRRIRSRPYARNLLIVISDGAPRDEATESVNGIDYLSRHLKQVIAELDKNTDIEVLAIGIGHDVSEFYQNAIVIPSEATLGDTLVDQLGVLLTQSQATDRRFRQGHGVWRGFTRSGLSL